MMRILRRARPSMTEGEAPFIDSILVARIRVLWERGIKFWRVFYASRLGMIGLILLLIFIFMAVSAPFLTSEGLLRDPEASLCAPSYTPCISTNFRLQPPNGALWLGSDHLGRDVFSRLWWGTQTTILIGTFASIISMGLGTGVGLVSGYYGGGLDEVLMRITDFFLVLPTLVLALILTGFLQESGGGSTWTIVWIIGISLWASTARLVRSQVLSLKERQFVERARAIGAQQSHIIWYHIFPNAFSLVFAESILTIAVAILTESFLSFIGLGPGNANTWGKMIEDAISHDAVTTPGLVWWIVAPGLAIVIVVLAFTLLGYALDEIFNPRLRRR